MLEVTERFSDMWIKELAKKTLPETYKPEIFCWLYIAWVYRKEKIFKSMSRIIEHECDETFEGDMEGPILSLR
jgi:hypothetical protein